MIRPTVGRVVLYRRPDAADGDQPLAALIAHVIDDHTVNLAIFNEDGGSHAQTGVTLAQDRDAAPGECGWMPYQVGQAAKAEQAESGLAEKFHELRQLVVGSLDAFDDRFKAMMGDKGPGTPGEPQPATQAAG